MGDIALFIVAFVLGWLCHTILIVRQVYKARESMAEKAIAESVTDTKEAVIEKIDDVYYAFNNADSAFMGQNTNLEELVYHILGKDDKVRLIIKDDDLKQEVIDLLSPKEKDTVPSSNQEHLDKHQA